ncbi:Uncharacterised protein [BD1-7 clade bacterium]|uniref:Uracil-DNA glycosylase-like domain-containing protein n=1 Tax=BD1-7 clade bacterium TaxID=2029982 RepID=A0A5S9PU70_9GAMM|nr:Uncharacterised protein [BD1-7 clade bacterium]CAA0108013.1 Uncharacterised protein [BD1-7 clade bacterium]
MSWSESFDAVVDNNTQVVILGSMPGVKSLEDAQYYAHPRNAFWPITQSLFGIPFSDPYDERLQRLNSGGLGLWDVYSRCYRAGSLDSNIDRSSASINDFAGLFQRFPHIHTVALNGKAAQNAFQKHVVRAGNLPNSVQCVFLPSTSPAYASMTFEQKLAAWQALQKALEDGVSMEKKEVSGNEHDA